MYRVKKRSCTRKTKLTRLVFIVCVIYAMFGIQYSNAASENWKSLDNQGSVGKYSSIVVNGTTPHVCYYDESNGNLKYATLDGSLAPVSSIIDTGGNNDVGRYCSIALDKSNGNLHVSYYDATAGSLKYAKRTGTTWSAPETVDSSVGTVNVTDDSKYNTSIDVDSNGNPYICYYDFGNHKLKYVRKSGAAWQAPETVPTNTGSDDIGQNCSIAVEGSGIPHISFYNAGQQDLMYATKDSSWHVETVDYSGDVGQYTSIALNTSNNRPNISYYDASNTNIKYAYKDSGGIWQRVTVDGSAVNDSGTLGQYSSLAIDSNNKPHISYYDASNTNLKYAYMDASGVWQVITVDDVSNTVNDVGLYSSIGVDSNNKPHISFYDATWKVAKYAFIAAPLITSTDPIRNSTSAPITGTIKITFNKDVQLGSNKGNIVLKDTSSYWGQTLSVTPSISGGNTLTLSAGNLKYLTTYSVTIPQGAVKDSNGYDYPITYEYSFKTQGDTAPTVMSSDPIDSSTGNPIDKIIKVIFSEPIDKGTSFDNITIKDSDGKLVGIKPGVSDNTLILNQSNTSISNVALYNLILGGNLNNTTSFTNNKKYTITIPAGSIADLAGNALASDFVFSFTTIPQGPTVASSVPTSGSSTVPVNQTIALKFNENIYSGSALATTTLKNSLGTIIQTNNTISGQTLLIDPIQNLAMGESYTLNAATDTVRNSSGQIMATTYTLMFKTQGPVIPTAPTGLKVSAATLATITIKWNTTSDALSYNVYRRSGNSQFVKVLNTTTNIYTDTAAKSKVTYVYTVTAVGTGGESAKAMETSGYLGMVVLKFTDIPATAWYRPYIIALTKKDAIDGYTNDQFKPNSFITRAEFAKTVCLAMGWPLRTPFNPTFSDVAKDNWAFPYVETAHSHGAYKGNIDNTFKPNELMTRADVAKVASLSLRLPSGKSKLKDIKYTWAKNYINNCVAAHIISGYPNGTFRPNDRVSRAEAARMICGMITYTTKNK